MSSSAPLPPPAPPAQMEAPPPATRAKKPRKKKDPNAPAAVSSAYAYFFKDTQASVKTHNPSAKFGEVSKIVASMWEALDDDGKAVYRKRNEEDKQRHTREMKAYRERQEMQQLEQEQQQQQPAPPPSKVSVTRGQHGSVRTLRQKATPPPAAASVRPSSPPVAEGEVMEHSCIRSGCTRRAVRNPEWEDEYCCNECVVSHCKDVFGAWVGQASLRLVT